MVNLPEDGYNRIFRGLLLALVGVVLFFLLYYHILPAIRATLLAVFPVALPFIFAGVLAALIDPVVNFFEQRCRFPRTWAVLVTMILFLGGTSLGLFFLISNMVIELENLAVTLPRLVRSSGIQLQELIAQLQKFYFSGQIPPQVMATFQSTIESLASNARDLMVRLTQWLVAFISILPEFFISVLIMLVATFFFSRDRDLILKNIRLLTPPRWRNMTGDILSSLIKAIIGFLRAETLLISIQIIQTTIGLLLLGVQYPLTLAFLIGLADLLPIVGPGTIYLPWVAWELIGGNYGMAIALLVLYGAIIILRQLLQPKLVAINLGLYPLTALVALYAGLKLMGIIGLVLGPLTIVILKAVLRSRYQNRRNGNYHA
ncbi:MAG: hypothetical protein PWP65_245 [Clostridia bacterium]|nr:hypothetical protein [Clostridia bacterium]